MFPERVGLVHVSGIDRNDLRPDQLSEPDRGLVSEQDRAGNISQLRALISGGYSGYVSIEPFSPEVQQDPGLPSNLASCVDYLRVGIEEHVVGA